MPPVEKKKPLLARISSLIDRKPRRAEGRSPLEGRKKKSPADLKKIVIAALGIVLLALIVVIAATAALQAVGGNTVATPTPVPAATPEPTPEATPEPTATPAPTPEPTPGPVISSDGPFNMHASLTASDGKCLVTLKLLTSSASVDVNTLKMNMEAEGRTFADVWTPRPMDWCNADNDTVLEQEEIIATVIDTSAKGIPQGVPLTISMVRDGEVLQAVTVLPA